MYYDKNLKEGDCLGVIPLEVNGEPFFDYKYEEGELFLQGEGFLGHIDEIIDTCEKFTKGMDPSYIKYIESDF